MGAHRESLGSVFADVVSGSMAETQRWALGACGLEDDDVADVITAMCKSDAVQEVDLTGNRLTDTACQKLCVGLAGGAAAQLQTIQLGGNSGITETGRNMFSGL